MKKTIAILALTLGSALSTAQPTYSLQQLKDSALANNIAMRNAHRNISAAQEQRQEAFTKYFPAVSATGLAFNANRGMASMDIDLSELATPELGTALSQMLPAEALVALQQPMSMSMMKNGVLAGVTAVLPVYAGGQIANGNRLARVGEDAARLQLLLTEDETERTTEQYYWQIVAMEEKQKTIAAAVALLTDIRKDAEGAVRAGVALRNDLLQVELRLNELESQKVKLRNGIHIVKQLLGQYAGLCPVATAEGCRYCFDIAIPDLDRENLAPASLLADSDAVAQLPEYQLLGKQVEAARLQMDMTLGQNLPSVAVGAGYNYHNLLGRSRTFAMVFATVSVPISDWWGGSHALKRKKMEYQKARDEQQDKAQLLAIRLENACNNAAEAYEQLRIAQRSIAQAEENLRLNRDYYAAGVATMTDLLQAQMLCQQARDKRTDAYTDYQNKLLAYRQASGKQER